MKPNFSIEYLPESDYYQAKCDKYPTLTIMDASPLEAMRRIIMWIRDRDEDASQP